jgi:Dynamin family
MAMDIMGKLPPEDGARELSKLINLGMDEKSEQDPRSGAFARDVLSVETEGPSRPQLTLVDIPGLIANATKGVTDADVKTVAEITDRYISQPRTICLAVISATNDHANQVSPSHRGVQHTSTQGSFHRNHQPS